MIVFVPVSPFEVQLSHYKAQEIAAIYHKWVVGKGIYSNNLLVLSVSPMILFRLPFQYQSSRVESRDPETM